MGERATNMPQNWILCVVICVWSAVKLTWAVPCAVNTCYNGGTCHEQNGHVSCHCTHGWGGQSCQSRTPDQTFWRITGTGNWLDFLRDCHMSEGTLATFPNEQTEITVRNITKDHNGFIGLTSARTSGIWRWTDTSTVATYSLFDEDFATDLDLKFAYAENLRWIAVTADTVKSAAWCMTRNPSVACSHPDKGCLFSQDNFLNLTGMTSNADLTLPVFHRDECQSLCLYSIVFDCLWFTLSGPYCLLGKIKQEVSDNKDSWIMERNKKEPTPLCIYLDNAAKTYDDWKTAYTEDPDTACKMVEIYSQLMLDKVTDLMVNDAVGQAFTGLYSMKLGNWRFSSGASPLFVNWPADASYPPQGGAGAVALLEDGTYLSESQSSVSLPAVCERPPGEENCKNAPNVTNTSWNIISSEQHWYVRYLCSENFINTLSITYTVDCPCGVSWEDVSIPECLEVNECESAPCQNGGTCIDGRNEYVCECSEGYSGSVCQIDESACSPEKNPCLNGATCSLNDATTICTCVPGFVGVMCETDFNECTEKTCFNGGTCVDGINSITCKCVLGYKGATCEINRGHCVTGSCLNGATCQSGADARTCFCTLGFTGEQCEVDIDECAELGCLKGGTCVGELESVECVCPGGSTGKRCELFEGPCNKNSCVNGGTCIMEDNTHTCVCLEKFEGFQCEWGVGCTITCLNRGVCTDNGKECICARGYKGNNCEINIDDCEDKPCAEGATCVDDVDSFSCKCPDGYKGLTCNETIAGFAAAGSLSLTSSENMWSISGIIVGLVTLTFLIFILLAIYCFRKKQIKVVKVEPARRVKIAPETH